MKVSSKASQSLVNSKGLSDIQDTFSRKGKMGEAKGADSIGATKVNLSSQAKEMQKAMEIAKDQSVDEAKVARLQKMIDAGDYKIESDKVAERILDEHLKMS